MVDWQGILAIEGTPTGDGRLLEAGALYWETLPLPLIWDRDDGDHSGVVVGTVTRIWRDGANVMGEGDLSDSEDDITRAAVSRVRELLTEGAVGVSVGLDSETIERRVDPDLLPEDDEYATITAALGGDPTLPVADADVPWSTAAARNRVFAAAQRHDEETGESWVEVSFLRRAFLWSDRGGDPNDKNTWKLGIADIIDGQLTIIPRAVKAAAGAGGFGSLLDLSEQQTARIQARCCRIYERIRDVHQDFADCPFTVSMETVDRMSHDDVIMAFTSARVRHLAIVDTPAVADARIGLVASLAGGAITAAAAVPDEVVAAFQNPTFGQSPHLDVRLVTQSPERPGEAVTFGAPLTIVDDKFVYGHACLWGRCHAGFKNACVVPPRGSEYSRFLHGSAIPGIPTGPLTAGTTHAMWDKDALEAFNHYANTGRAVADVAVGEDHLGLWVAGMLRPGITDRDLADLKGSSLSGDWRPVNGKYRLVGLLAVNQPGYLVQRVAPDGQGVITAGPCACDDVDPMEAMWARVSELESAVAELRNRDHVTV